MGFSFFDKLDRDVALHLAEVKAYKNGTVELRYEVRAKPGEPSGTRSESGNQESMKGFVFRSPGFLVG